MLDFFLSIFAVLSLVLTFWRWVVSELFSLHRTHPLPAVLPGMTLLKPLKGCNDETQRCLRSWFAQKYPGPLQMLCGVADADDPVCEIIYQLMAEFPHVDARLVVCERSFGANGKVSTLCQLEPSIAYPLIMMSDCDVEVPPDFAAGVGEQLSVEGVGLVNCFYRLANPTTLAMQWEAIAINGDFWSQVLQARSFGPIDFALGAVMSMPAAMLSEIGGFAHLADYLADDFELGQSISRTERRIEFAHAVVDCREAPAGWASIWKHQLRWARTIRSCKPAPYFMSLLGNATLWPLLWLWGKTNPLAVPFFIVALSFRILTAMRQQGRLTNSRSHWFYWWLIPVKDILDVLIWMSAFWGNHIEWRRERYRIITGGKLLKIESAPASFAAEFPLTGPYSQIPLQTNAAPRPPRAKEKSLPRPLPLPAQR